MTQEQRTARHIIVVLKGQLKREAQTRARLEELRTKRLHHAALVLLPAERVYRDAERVDFGFAVGIAELERALKEKE